MKTDNGTATQKVSKTGAERGHPDFQRGAERMPGYTAAEVMNKIPPADMFNEYAWIGLGLVISRQLVEEHGGEMWVESRFGTGSTFSFTIPQ